MDRREFHKVTLATAAAAIVPDVTAVAGAVPAPPSDLHPGDVPPPGASVRFGTTRFHHLVEAGNGGLCALAFSPDGRTLAALGLQDDHVSLWAVPSGRLIRKWGDNPADRRGDVAFSPCGRYLAVCGQGVRVWDLPGEWLLWDARDKYTGTAAVAFTPDGRLLAVADGGCHGVVCIREATTGALVREFIGEPHAFQPGLGQDWFASVAVSPDGRLVAAGSRYDIHHETPEGEDVSIQRLTGLINGEGGRPASELKALCSRLDEEYGSLHLRWRHHTGRTLISEPRGRVWVWELMTGRLVAKLEGHTHGVAHVGFTPAGEVVSVGENGATCVWEVAGGMLLRELVAGGTYRVKPSVAILPGGRAVAVGREGHGLWFVDVATGGGREPAGGPNWERWRRFAASSDGRWYAVGGPQIHLWDAAAGRDATPAERHSGPVDEVRFSPDGRRVVTVTATEVFGWDADTGRRVWAFRPTTELDQDSLVLATAGARGACIRRPHHSPAVVHVWDAATRQERAWDEPGAAIATWAVNGRQLLVATAAGELKSHPFKADEPVLRFDRPGRTVSTLAVSPDGGTVAGLESVPDATAATLYVWDAATGSLRHRIALPPGPRVKHPWPIFPVLAFGPDGRSIAAFRDTAVYQGPVTAGRLDPRPVASWLCPETGQIIGPIVAAFRPDGCLLPAGSGGTAEDVGNGPYAIWVWDVASGRELWSSPPQRHEIYALAFSPDAARLATGSADTTALVWDLAPYLG